MFAPKPSAAGAFVPFSPGSSILTFAGPSSSLVFFRADSTRSAVHPRDDGRSVPVASCLPQRITKAGAYFNPCGAAACVSPTPRKSCVTITSNGAVAKQSRDCNCGHGFSLCKWAGCWLRVFSEFISTAIHLFPVLMARAFFQTKCLRSRKENASKQESWSRLSDSSYGKAPVQRKTCCGFPVVASAALCCGDCRAPFQRRIPAIVPPRRLSRRCIRPIPSCRTRGLSVCSLSHGVLWAPIAR